MKTLLYTLGPAGTFSDKAAQGLNREISSPHGVRFAPTISSVFDAVMLDPCALGVVPIANSIAGTVAVTQDLLMRGEVRIEYEIQVPIAFKLITAAPLQDVRQVFVHPIHA